jgi:hypothetical protein
MKSTLIGFITCLLLFNCAKKEEKIVTKNNPYIISEEDIKLQKYKDSLKKSGSKIVLPDTKGFYYAENQLIIDNKRELFYYQREYIQILCNYGNENDTLPHFINLKTKDIIKIPQKSLDDFISENIMPKEKRRQILIIASQSDTITNTYFLNFIKKSHLLAYHIRRTTQEEDTVLKYKRNNDYYYSDSIKWDKTKIKFPKYKIED